MPSTLLFGLGQAGVTARLWSKSANEPPQSFDESIGYPGVWDTRTSDEADGSIGFQLVPAGPTRVWFRKSGYLDQYQDYLMPDDGAKEVRLEKAPIKLPRLTWIDRGRHRFMTASGTPVFIKGVTDFSLLMRFMDGENIDQRLAERAALGFNCVRVFGMMHYIPLFEFNKPAFRPQDHPDYYDKLTEFCLKAESYGLYVYFSVFPDAGIVMPNLTDQQAHYGKVHERFAGLDNVILELTNEIDAHDFNWVDAAKFPKPSSYLGCSGSGGEGLHSNQWDFFDFHQRRDYPATIKDANLVDNPNFLAGKDGLMGEPDRYGSNGNGSSQQAHELAGSTIGSTLGVVFHSTNGKRSDPFDDLTKECAVKFVEAFDV